MSSFQRATKRKSKGHMALVGPAGSGKTFGALRVGRAMVGPKGTIALIDSERGSASKYAGDFEFDVAELDGDYDPRNYIKLIKEAAATHDLVIVDSLTHAWAGAGGALEMVDKAARRTGNSYTAWSEVTPIQNKLIDAILNCDAHIIVTMRSKMQYVLNKNDKGKQVPTKIGMGAIQRDGIEYEFDVTAEITVDHDCYIAKTRCSALDGKSFERANEELAKIFMNWLDDGAEPLEKPATPEPEPQPPEPTTEEKEQRRQAAQGREKQNDAGKRVASKQELMELVQLSDARAMELGYEGDKECSKSIRVAAQITLGMTPGKPPPADAIDALAAAIRTTQVGEDEMAQATVTGDPF